MTKKVSVTFRFSHDTIRKLNQLEEACGEYGSRTALLEAAILKFWQIRFEDGVIREDDL